MPTTRDPTPEQREAAAKVLRKFALEQKGERKKRTMRHAKSQEILVHYHLRQQDQS